jgi:hypothetical protein
MTAPWFADPTVRPTEPDVLAVLGPAANAWRTLFAALRTQHSDLAETWNWYADGRSWLMKITRKGRTVCWVVVEPERFRVAFYFAERLTPALLASGLSEPCKAALGARPPVGKLRPVSVEFGPAEGVGDVLVLVGLKAQLK